MPTKTVKAWAVVWKNGKELWRIHRLESNAVEEMISLRESELELETKVIPCTISFNQ